MKIKNIKLIRGIACLIVLSGILATSSIVKADNFSWTAANHRAGVIRPIGVPMTPQRYPFRDRMTMSISQKQRTIPSLIRTVYHVIICIWIRMRILLVIPDIISQFMGICL